MESLKLIYDWNELVNYIKEDLEEARSILPKRIYEELVEKLRKTTTDHGLTIDEARKIIKYVIPLFI